MGTYFETQGICSDPIISELGQKRHLCLDALHAYLLMVLRRRAQGCFSLFFFRYNTFHHLHIGCLCVHH